MSEKATHLLIPIEVLEKYANQGIRLIDDILANSQKVNLEQFPEQTSNTNKNHGIYHWRTTGSNEVQSIT